MKNNITLLMTVLFFSASAQTPTAAENKKIKKDLAFISDAAQGALMEVKLGQLAQTNALTPEVKTDALQMVTDHGKESEALTGLANKKTFSLPASLSSKMQKEYDELAKLNGTGFDKKYARNMIKDHKKDLCAFKREAKKGKDPDIRSWANNMIPQLEEHLNLWKDAYKAAKSQPPARTVVSK